MKVSSLQEQYQNLAREILICWLRFLGWKFTLVASSSPRSTKGICINMDELNRKGGGFQDELRLTFSSKAFCVLFFPSLELYSVVPMQQKIPPTPPNGHFFLSLHSPWMLSTPFVRVLNPSQQQKNVSTSKDHFSGEKNCLVTTMSTMKVADNVVNIDEEKYFFINSIDLWCSSKLLTFSSTLNIFFLLWFSRWCRGFPEVKVCLWQIHLLRQTHTIFVYLHSGALSSFS